MPPYTLMQSHFSAKSIKLFKGFSAQSASYPTNLKRYDRDNQTGHIQLIIRIIPRQIKGFKGCNREKLDLSNIVTYQPNLEEK